MLTTDRAADRSFFHVGAIAGAFADSPSEAPLTQSPGCRFNNRGARKMNHMTKPLHQPSVVEDTIITSRLRSNLTSTSKQLSVRGLGCSMRRALVVNIPRSRRYGGRTSLCFVLFAFARAMSSSVTCISFGYTGYDCSSQSNPSAGRKQPGSAARALATPTLPPHGLGTAWLAQPCGELEGDPGRLGVPLVPANGCLRVTDSLAVC